MRLALDLKFREGAGMISKRFKNVSELEIVRDILQAKELRRYAKKENFRFFINIILYVFCNYLVSEHV